LNTGLAPGGLPRLTSKLVKCYNCKRRNSRFLNMDNSLIAEASAGILCPTSLFWCNDRLGPVPIVADWIQPIFEVGG